MVSRTSCCRSSALVEDCLFLQPPQQPVAGSQGRRVTNSPPVNCTHTQRTRPEAAHEPGKRMNNIHCTLLNTRQYRHWARLAGKPLAPEFHLVHALGAHLPAPRRLRAGC